MPGPLQANRQDECCQPSHSTGAPVLQVPADGSGRSLKESGPGLRCLPSPVGGQQGGASLVGHKDDPLEWENNPDAGSPTDHRVRCLNRGLGSNMPGIRHRWAMVRTGEDLAYKLPRAPSSHTGTENVREEENQSVSAAQIGQYNSCGLHKQSGWDNFKETCRPDTRPMDVVPGEEYTRPSPTPAGSTELYGGQGVQVNEGSIRLETEPQYLLQDQQSLWATGSGPIRIQTDTSVPTLLQLAARSICRGRRCLPAGLDNGEGICKPPLEPYSPSAESGTISGGGPGPSGPTVESSAMVCCASVNASGLATPTPTAGAVHTDGKDGSKSKSSRMEHIRKDLKNQGLSEQATSLIIHSWRVKTNRSYDSLFKRWNRWCRERNSDPISGPVSEVANFLASLFQEGYQYSSVNAYRSAISSVHDRVDGVTVGQHPTIVRLVKGIFNVRPPVPRYSTTWDVQQVLNFLEAAGEPANASLKALTHRTVFLMAITRPSRSADLSQLNIDRMKIQSNGVAFIPTVLAKQSRQGKPIEEFFFPSLPGNSNLCPVETLKVYLEKTRSLRGEEPKLFVSFIKPHRAVTSSSIARWLKTILEEAGVDTSLFGAHSTRGASASAASSAGITTGDILKAANWSSESVFQRFYHKKVNKAVFGRAVLNQNSSE